MRSPRCVACTRGSPDEALGCASRRRSLVTAARGRLHPLQDRPRQDAATSSRAASLPWVALSAVLTLVTVPPMAWRWQRLLAARGVHERLSLADARVLRLLRRRAGAADVGRRRRLADLRDVAPPPGPDHADHRLGAARARARRRGDAAARRRRAPARDRPLPDRRRTSGSRSLFVVATIAAGVVFFSRTVRRRLAFVRAARAALPGRGARARGLRRHPRLPRPPRDARSSSPRSRSAAQLTRIVAIYASGRAVGIHLSLLPVRRARAAALPRDARAVHGQRHRRARGVLRQLPRQARRRRRPRVRLRLPVLPDDDPARAARGSR